MLRPVKRPPKPHPKTQLEPQLEPQQTVAYEIGLQQAFSDRIGINLTVYNKDIRNLLGTRIETIAPVARSVGMPTRLVSSSRRSSARRLSTTSGRALARSWASPTSCARSYSSTRRSVWK